MRPTESASATLLVECRQENSEVAPGVTIERRFFLNGSIAAAIALVLTSPRQLLGITSKKWIQAAERTASRSSSGLSWEEFINQTVPLAQAALKDAEGKCRAVDSSCH